MQLQIVFVLVPPDVWSGYPEDRPLAKVARDLTGLLRLAEKGVRKEETRDQFYRRRARISGLVRGLFVASPGPLPECSGTECSGDLAEALAAVVEALPSSDSGVVTPRSATELRLALPRVLGTAGDTPYARLRVTELDRLVESAATGKGVLVYWLSR